MNVEAKLALAKRLLQQAKESFNTEVEACPCCGTEKFVNWNERKIKDALNAAISRIEKVIGQMKQSDFA